MPTSCTGAWCSYTTVAVVTRVGSSDGRLCGNPLGSVAGRGPPLQWGAASGGAWGDPPYSSWHLSTSGGRRRLPAAARRAPPWCRALVALASGAPIARALPGCPALAYAAERRPVAAASHRAGCPLVVCADRLRLPARAAPLLLGRRCGSANAGSWRRTDGMDGARTAVVEGKAQPAPLLCDRGRGSQRWLGVGAMRVARTMEGRSQQATDGHVSTIPSGTSVWEGGTEWAIVDASNPADG